MISKRLQKELTAAIIGGLTLRSSPVWVWQNESPSPWQSKTQHIFFGEESSGSHEMYIQRHERTKWQKILLCPHIWEVTDSLTGESLFSIRDRANSRALQKIFDKRYKEKATDGIDAAKTKAVVLKALRMDSPKENDA